MQVEILHYKLEREWDKLSNKHRRYLTDLEKDEILNIAIRDYFDIFAHGRNEKGYKLGLEVTQQRIDMLETLVRSYPEITTISPTVNDGIYIYDLPEDYGSYISSSVAVKDCDNDFIVNIEQHGDLNTVLQDYHRSSSKKFRKVVGTIRNGKLYLYPGGEFITQGLKLTYLKEPNEVCLGTYTEVPTVDIPSPPIKPQVDCDLPDRYIDLLMVIAVSNLSRIYDKNPVLHEQKINSNT